MGYFTPIHPPFISRWNNPLILTRMNIFPERKQNRYHKTPTTKTKKKKRQRFDSTPSKKRWPYQKEKIVFQPSFFRGEPLNFGGSKHPEEDNQRVGCLVKSNLGSTVQEALMIISQKNTMFVCSKGCIFWKFPGSVFPYFSLNLWCFRNKCCN